MYKVILKTLNLNPKKVNQSDCLKHQIEYKDYSII